MNVVDGLVMLGRDTLLEAFGDLEGLCNDLETANPRWMTTAEVERLFKMTAAALGLVRVGLHTLVDALEQVPVTESYAIDCGSTG